MRRETRRLQRELLAEALQLMEEDRLTALARQLTNGETPVLLHRLEPVTADALLPFARQKCRVPIVSPAGYAASAEAFAARTGLRLISQSALLDTAAKEGLTPDRDAVYAHILTLEEKRRAKRKRLGGLPFSEGSAKKYLAVALVLFGLSFVSRYALYYRMLAALCMSVFSVNFLMDRTRPRSSGIE